MPAVGDGAAVVPTVTGLLPYETGFISVMAGLAGDMVGDGRVGEN